MIFKKYPMKLQRYSDLSKKCVGANNVNVGKNVHNEINVNKGE